MAEGRDLIKEALQDAKSLKEAAVESAKNELVEKLAPAVKELLEKSIKSNRIAENKGYDEFATKNKEGSGQKAAENRNPDDPEKSVGEGKSPELTLEDAIGEFFTVKENQEMADSKKSAKSVKETDSNKENKSSVNEDIEISEAELKKVYEEALKTEVAVKKGFGDIAKPAEIEDALKDSGLPGAKPKDKNWETETPPAKKDWIPENVEKMLQAGLSENKALRENLRKAVAMIETLGKKLHEVNLFNSKVLHVNKVLNGAKLTTEQKKYVMESIDQARSIAEVKMVFETIVRGIKTTQAALTENRVARPPKADAQKARTSGTPDQKVLRESVDRSTTDKYSRLERLAGIVDGKK